MERSRGYGGYVLGVGTVRPAISADVLVGGLLALGVFSLGLLMLPRLAFPLQDEVHYVGPAVWFAETGELVLPETSASFVAAAAFGAAFVKLFGGDFITLRLAMLVAATTSAVIFYALLRHLGYSRAQSGLATGVLATNPLFVTSSGLFITESPFLLLVLGSLYCGMLALERGSVSLLFLAGVLAGGAFLTRQIGVVVAVALALGLLARPHRRRAVRLWVTLLLPPAAMAAAYTLLGSGPEGSGARSYLTTTLVMWTEEVNPWHLARVLNLALPYAGLFTLPLLLMHVPAIRAALAALDRRRKLALLSSLLFVAAGYLYEWMKGVRHFPYFGNTLDPRGLYMKDFTDIAQWAPAPWLLAGTVALWVAAGVAIGLIAGALSWPPRRWLGHPHFPLYFTGVIFALASFTAHALVDRYFLPWVPFLLLAVLAALGSARPSAPLAVALLVGFAALNVVLMGDYSQRAAQRWDISRQLVERGIPTREIAASWEWRYWWGYWQVYHIGEAPPGKGGEPLSAPDAITRLRLVESLADRRREVDLPYRITAFPQDGYEVEETYSYWTPLGLTQRHIYLLRATASD